MNDKRHRKSLVSSNGTGTVNTTVMSEGIKVEENSKEISLPSKQIPVNPARVGVFLHETLNVGDYSNIRVDVYFEMPCNPTYEDMQSEYESLKQLAKANLTSTMEEQKQHFRRHGEQWGNEVTGYNSGKFDDDPFGSDIDTDSFDDSNESTEEDPFSD